MEAKHKTPKYRRHRSGGLDRAFVELNGRRIYLGRYGSPGSREKYDREVANWLANGRRVRRAGPNPTVAELRNWIKTMPGAGVLAVTLEKEKAGPDRPTAITVLERALATAEAVAKEMVG